MEFTINQNSYDILRAVCQQRPDVIGFSCYIFNIRQIENLTIDIKKLLPDVKIVLGGPEVSFDAENVRKRCAADYIISGEGERALNSLLSALEKGCEPPSDEGITGSGTGSCCPAVLCSLDSLPSPYTDEMLENARGRILYFEASRGCPFSCAYCLSPAGGGVRFFSMPRVESDLLRVMRSPAKQIKFVDRTFNCDRRRAAHIIQFIMDAAANDESGVVRSKNFHFEAAADLFDDSLIELLARAPRGLFQLEIGIQSLNARTLEAVSRKTDVEKCLANIKKLLEPGNIHIHLDLIAGLPYENYESFARSFNGVFSLRPHCIQLGFLKLLKGSALRPQADEQPGYAYRDDPPYEVLYTPWLAFEKLSKLKDIAECVERLYNSGKFALSLTFLAAEYDSPFLFFSEFADFLSELGCFDRALSLRELYDRVSQFASKTLDQSSNQTLNELLKFDYFSTDSACCPPVSLKRIDTPNARLLYTKHRPENGARIHIETFTFDPLAEVDTASPELPVTYCFYYQNQNPITGKYRCARV